VTSLGIDQWAVYSWNEATVRILCWSDGTFFHISVSSLPKHVQSLYHITFECDRYECCLIYTVGVIIMKGRLFSNMISVVLFSFEYIMVLFRCLSAKGLDGITW